MCVCVCVCVCVCSVCYICVCTYACVSMCVVITVCLKHMYESVCHCYDAMMCFTCQYWERSMNKP